MAITTYAELQTAASNWLNRSDLTSILPDFITLAEGKLKKDPRVRRLEDNTTLTVDAVTEALPSDFLALEALYHDGSSHYGPIQIVPQEVLGQVRGRDGDSGVPAYAAIVDGNLRFAPVPDGTYTLRMSYWQGITALSAGNTSNWLLTSHPDIYLYATLCESAPYLHDDERLPVWRAQLEDRLQGLQRVTWDLQWSGTLRRQYTPIGG